MEAREVLLLDEDMVAHELVFAGYSVIKDGIVFSGLEVEHSGLGHISVDRIVVPFSKCALGRFEVDNPVPGLYIVDGL